MNNRRFLINLVLLLGICAITVGMIIAILLGKISHTAGIIVITMSVLFGCLGLAFVNYRYSAYGKQFSSRYPDSVNE
ncbi:hypothetical protein IM774_11220 [Erysipelotrichaceae bacterium RD49]|nr:hypothetical protein [Erysipelotrichaceae bacterium RD49]